MSARAITHDRSETRAAWQMSARRTKRKASHDEEEALRLVMADLEEESNDGRSFIEVCCADSLTSPFLASMQAHS